MKYFVSILLCFVFSYSFSQTYQPENINKNALDVYERAVQQLRDGSLIQAIPLLEKAIEYEKTKQSSIETKYFILVFLLAQQKKMY